MGASKVEIIKSEADRKGFVEHVLRDLKTLKYMLENDVFESDVQRIGAEQELYLVDKQWYPAPYAMEMMESLNDPDFTTEFARFNLELNLPPFVFQGDALSKMEGILSQKLQKAREAAEKLEAGLVQVGILPTLRRHDLEEHNLTPLPRYRLLAEVLHQLRGGLFDLHIEGRDELILGGVHALYEASNTSFQVHYQLDPREIVPVYNWAQLVTAPLLAVSVNSPLLLGSRLWKETRIALFQQSIDTRNPAELLRKHRPRVSFGHDWLHHSLLEIYQEDIMRHRSILRTTETEDAWNVLQAGGVPSLHGLNTHNGTIYRWNRICYGSTGGKPHIRIENRVIPSGPSTGDQFANMAFWLGLLHGMPETYRKLPERMPFEQARDNFSQAARHGLETQFHWPGHARPVAASELILETLLPIARAGLERAGIHPEDITRYLGIIEARAASGKTGARWQLRSFERLRQHATVAEALPALTAAMQQNQQSGAPVHTWSLAKPLLSGGVKARYQYIRELMTTDIFLVHEQDSMALAASIMNWQTIRHILVENDEKKLVGIVSVKDFVRWFADAEQSTSLPSVRELMSAAPVTVSPETPTREALQLMQRKKVACLPVLEQGKLVGVVSEHDFSRLARYLLEEE